MESRRKSMKLSHKTGIVIAFALVLPSFAFIVETTYEFQITLFGVLWFMLAAAWCIHSAWGMKVPYIRITDRKIMFMKDVRKKPGIVDLNAVQKIHVETWTNIPSRVDLILSDGKSIRINMSDIQGDDRKALISLLGRFVTHIENT